MAPNLCAMLDDMRGVAGERLTILNDETIDATLEPGGVRLELRSGQIVAADSVIIAPGNLPPHDLPAFAGLRGPAYVRNASGANILSTRLFSGLAKDLKLAILPYLHVLPFLKGARALIEADVAGREL